MKKLDTTSLHVLGATPHRQPRLLQEGLTGRGYCISVLVRSLSSATPIVTPTA